MTDGALNSSSARRTPDRPIGRSAILLDHAAPMAALASGPCSPDSPPMPAGDPAMTDGLGALVDQLGLRSVRRHIFLCADQTKPKCCEKGIGLASWEYLKRRLKELGLVGPGASVCRTKANCLQVCERGPVAVVYPE